MHRVSESQFENESEARIIPEWTGSEPASGTVSSAGEPAIQIVPRRLPRPEETQPLSII